MPPRSGTAVLVLAALLTIACRDTRAPEITPVREMRPVPDATPPPVSLPATAVRVPDAAIAADVIIETYEDPPAPSSWSDPDGVAMLARDCHAVSPFAGQFDSMTCGGNMSQACAFDPCSGETHDCQMGCTGRCDACESACTTRCDACKLPCTDDACRTACARGCGACRDRGLRADERCDTGECAPVVTRCYATVRARWRQSGCPAECRAYLACTHAPGDPSPETCEQHTRHRCPEELFVGACEAGNSRSFPR